MKKRKGFLKLIIIVVIGLIILAYFKVDLRKYAESPTAQAVIGKTTDISVYVWEHYLKTATLYVYNDVLFGVVWPTIKSHLPEKTTAPSE